MYPADLLNQLIKTGEPITVQFTPKVEDGINLMNALMKAKLINVVYVKGDGCYKLIFSMNDFLEFNKTVAVADFYDDNNVPRLTWFETKHYPANGIVDIYVDPDYEVDIFNVINDEYKILLTYEINGVPQLTLLNDEVELNAFISQHPKIKATAFKVFDAHKIPIGDETNDSTDGYPCTDQDCYNCGNYNATCQTECAYRKSIINEGR